MKILVEDPPYNIREMCEKYTGMSNVKPIYTFGDVIYNPLNAPLDKFLIAHELAHKEQQGSQPALWWNKWFDDEEFRFEQEWQAYHVQYVLLKKKIKDRNQLHEVLHMLACDLSGKMYGKLCTYAQAISLIKKGVIA